MHPVVLSLILICADVAPEAPTKGTQKELQQALKSGSIVEVQALLQRGLHSEAKLGAQQLQSVFKAGHRDLAAWLLKQREFKGYDLLAEALANSKDIPFAEFLMDQGVDTELNILKFCIEERVLKWALAKRAHSVKQLNEGFDLALGNRRSANIRLLLDAGARPGADLCRRAWGSGTGVIELLNSRGFRVPLETAIDSAQYGQGEEVRLFLKLGRKLDQALFDACCRGGLADLMEEGLRLGLKPSQNAAIGAAAGGHLEILKRLQSLGAKLETRMLDDAISSRRTSMVKYLLDQQVKPGPRTLIASQSSSPEIKRLIELQNPPLSQETLMAAIKSGDLPLLRQCLATKGIDVNADQGAPLKTAIDRSKREVIPLLLAAGARPDLGKPWNSPLELSMGDLQIFSLLLAAMPELFPEDPDRAGQILARAQRQGDDWLKPLLACKLGALLDRPDFSGATVVSRACAECNTSLLPLIFATGGHPDSTQEMAQMPLAAAIRSQHKLADKMATIQLLLAHGAKPDAIDRYGENSLTYALQVGELEVIKFLLSKGVKPRTEGFKRWAIRKKDVLEQLLKNGLKLENDDLAKSIAHKGDLDLIQSLIDDHHLKPDAQMITDACWNGSVEIVKLLLKHCRADVNHMNACFVMGDKALDLVTILREHEVKFEAGNYRALLEHSSNVSADVIVAKDKVRELLIASGVRPDQEVCLQMMRAKGVTALLRRLQEVDAQWFKQLDLGALLEDGVELGVDPDIVAFLLAQGGRLTQEQLDQAASGNLKRCKSYVLALSKQDPHKLKSMNLNSLIVEVVSSSDDPDTVKFLLDFGASRAAMNQEGETLKMIAKDAGYEKTLELLRQLPKSP